jgi:hypothetical protein
MICKGGEKKLKIFSGLFKTWLFRNKAALELY